MTVWSEGFGYSDIENDVPCKPSSVMRVASISKSLTATAASKDFNFTKTFYDLSRILEKK